MKNWDTFKEILRGRAVADWASKDGRGRAVAVSFCLILSSFSEGLFRSLFSVLERDLSGLSMW